MSRDPFPARRIILIILASPLVLLCKLHHKHRHAVIYEQRQHWSWHLQGLALALAAHPNRPPNRNLLYFHTLNWTNAPPSPSLTPPGPQSLNLGVFNGLSEMQLL